MVPRPVTAVSRYVGKLLSGCVSLAKLHQTWHSFHSFCVVVYIKDLLCIKKTSLESDLIQNKEDRDVCQGQQEEQSDDMSSWEGRKHISCLFPCGGALSPWVDYFPSLLCAQYTAKILYFKKILDDFSTHPDSSLCIFRTACLTLSLVRHSCR